MENYAQFEREYDAECEKTRSARAAWFSDARFGLFIHYGLFALDGMGEWAQFTENRKISEYESLAREFRPKEGCADEWCRLAVRAGAKYAVLTTRHHEGFCLWDSKANPFNSWNACGRDLVREFTDACRKYGLRIGLYSSLMEWRHPDSWRCMNDPEARRRYLDYIEALNTELLTGYGKIDVLWYDMPWPQMSAEEWDSVNRNRRLRALQPDILINNRSRMHEDFYTPEESLNLPPADRERVEKEGADWEACMTFNGFSWGYVDAEQAAPYAYSAQRVARLMQKCVEGGGNLLLNIGPAPDGSVPGDAVLPLEKFGQWLKVNGEAVYGKKLRRYEGQAHANQVTGCTASLDRKTVYAWNYIWPRGGKMAFGGYVNAPKRVTVLSTGEEISFTHDGHRLILENLPERSPDPVLGIAVIKMEFDEPFECRYGSYYPQMTNGMDLSDDLGNP